MHESAIAMQIIESVERLVQKGDITGKVSKIFLKVGRLTTIVPECLEFAFDALVTDSSLAGARLEIEKVEIRGKCGACGADFDIPEPIFFCPACGSPDSEVVKGRELTIEAVEVE